MKTILFAAAACITILAGSAYAAEGDSFDGNDLARRASVTAERASSSAGNIAQTDQATRVVAMAGSRHTVSLFPPSQSNG